MVGRRGEDLCCVELKLSLNRRVIQQAMYNQLVTMHSWCAVASRPRNLDRAKKVGLGVIVVGNPMTVLLEPSERLLEPSERLLEPSERGFPRFSGPDEIMSHLDMLPTGGVAGRQCIAGTGPAQDVARAVRVYMDNNPAASWAQIFAAIPNHYAHPRSMANALTQRAVTRRILDGGHE